MGHLIWIFVLGVLGVLGAALSRQLADELKAWTPRITRWLVLYAVRKLPPDQHAQRKRFEEEWQSHVDEVPGELGKLFSAISLLAAPRRMPVPTHAIEPTAEKMQRQLRAFIDEGVLVHLSGHGHLLDNPVIQWPQWPPFCEKSPNGRHSVPSAAVYPSAHFGGWTFRGPCEFCGISVDTGEPYPD